MRSERDRGTDSLEGTNPSPLGRGKSEGSGAASTKPSPLKEATLSRLAKVRALMAEAGLQALLVRSTDRHLNEYVPDVDSTRQWLTAFTGSMGEALVFADKALLFVDGRYHLQADNEVDAAAISVVKVGLGESVNAAVLAHLGRELLSLAKKHSAATLRVGYEPERLAVADLTHFEESLQKSLGTTGVAWVPSRPSLVEQVRGPIEAQVQALRALDEAKLDQGAEAKIVAVSQALVALGPKALLVTTLDELAYLTNLRGDDIPFSSTFRGLGLVVTDANGNAKLLLSCNPSQVTNDIRLARQKAIQFVDEGAFWAEVSRWAGARKPEVGYDARLTTAYNLDELRRAGADPVSLTSPIGAMKAKKGPKELKAMSAAFAKADKVVSLAAAWLCNEVSSRGKISEADFAAKVEALFKASGARALSFKIISAAGRNGASIHYSHPNPRRIIKQGELMLLDTGAYYDEGYATDLTRTFLVGPKSLKATSEQKRYFTLVLKCAIAGMRARIPMGTRGDQLDAICRAPLWQEGHNYNHGTGHGVGVNVHEFPPRIAPQGHGVLEEGMVFSIEPGVYLEKFGGVRIENLCTLERPKGMPATLAVRPLTFSPLDQRLIERKLLNEEERAWLAQYMRGRAPR